MKILGIGVDIVDNKRLRKLIKDKKFINRTFGKKEIELSKRFEDKANYFAKRFAAKEALSKALGTGFRYNLNFKDIEIINDNLGKPYYLNSVKIDQFVKKIYKASKYNLHLSISDEKEYSMAFTILQKK